MQFIDLQAQYQHLKNRIDTRIQTVLDHGKYILGPEVQEFEEQLSNYVGVKHTIGVANGTDALQLALMALGVSNGDAVFVPTFTFFASAEVVPLVGATAIFADINEKTYNICPVDLEAKIEKTLKEGSLVPKVIIAVDLFGLPADYAAIKRIADKYNLYVIEDAAQGFGGSINDKKAGSFGDIATTSFFPAKPLGCYGDGGAAFTNDDDLAEIIRSLRVHGKGKDKYDNVRIGLNSRLDTIQAAVLIEKLIEFPIELEARQVVANRYSGALEDKFYIPFLPQGFKSSWAQYTIQAKKGDRKEPMAQLKNAGIPSVVYYGTNMHEQTAFKKLGYKHYNLSQAETTAKSVFSLPMHPYMLEDQQMRIISSLNGT